MDNEMFLNNMLIPINRSYGAFVWNKLYKSEIIGKYNIRFPSEKRYLFEDHYFNYFNYEYMKYAKRGCYIPVFSSSLHIKKKYRDNTGD